jgi:hypothetical protein
VWITAICTDTRRSSWSTVTPRWPAGSGWPGVSLARAGHFAERLSDSRSPTPPQPGGPAVHAVLRRYHTATNAPIPANFFHVDVRERVAQTRTHPRRRRPQTLGRAQGRARAVRHGWVPQSVVGVRIRFSTDPEFRKVVMSVEGRQSVTGVLNKLVCPDVEILRS